MPTITVTTTICPKCGKKTCDGAIWRYVKIVEYERELNFPYRIVYTGREVEVDLSKTPEENMEGCTLQYGVSRRKFLKGKKVGDEVRIEFKNWARPSWVIMRKMED
jgi:hypothetical protein